MVQYHYNCVIRFFVVERGIPMIYRISRDDNKKLSHLQACDKQDSLTFKLLDGNRINDDWHSFSVKLIEGDNKQRYCYIFSFGDIILTKEAIDRLQSLLGSCAEYLPLSFDGETVYLLNILHKIKCLDLEKSRYISIPINGDNKIIGVQYPVLKADLIPEDTTLFVCEEHPRIVFFTEQAKIYFELHCPNGFYFEEVITSNSLIIQKQIINNNKEGSIINNDENSSDCAFNAMSKWLSHPSELGRLPLDIKIIAHRTMEWPFFDTPQEVFLLAYTMPNQYKGIGITGPITWSFMGNIPFDKFSYDELYLLYAGWYILFAIINKPGYKKPENLAKEQQLISRLKKQGYSQIEVTNQWHIGNVIYYEAKLSKAGISYKMAGSLQDHSIYRANDILKS